MIIAKVFPVVRSWWKKRERSTDVEKRYEERVHSTTQGYRKNRIEQEIHIVYNKKGMLENG